MRTTRQETGKFIGKETQIQKRNIKLETWNLQGVHEKGAIKLELRDIRQTYLWTKKHN